MQRYVGVDLGIRSPHRVAVLDGSERRGKPFSVEVSREGFERFLKRATEGAEGRIKIVMEPTGLAWVPLAAYSSAAGHQIYLAKPQKAKQLRKFLREYTKTDCVDAETAARLPQVDPRGVHELSLPTAKQMTLLRLVKRRERLAEQIGDIKRRVHALMVMANPPLMSALGDSAFGQGARAFLRKYADPQDVIKKGTGQLKKFWHKHSKGQASQQIVDRVFEACKTTVELYRELRQKGKLPFDYFEVHKEITADLDLIEYLEHQVEQLNERISEKYQECDPERTLEKQLPGIGSVIAPALEALVGNVNRFSNGRKFVAYTGLCPRKKQSGTRDQAMPITKAGNRLVKKYLYLAADVARHYDPDFAVAYARRYARGDQHNRIMIILARKMALRVYALLKRREQVRSRQTENASQQHHVPSTPEPVQYVLRDPDGHSLDKKQARQLIAAKYTRAHANPERCKHEKSRRNKTLKQKKTENTMPAKVEWPPKDATSENTVPPSFLSLSLQQPQSNRTDFDGNWESVGDILKRLLQKMAVQKP